MSYNYVFYSEYVVIGHIIEAAQLKSPHQQKIDPDKSLLQYPHSQLKENVVKTMACLAHYSNY